MPFTFSHPAIVLPLKKAMPGWFSLTGLVIGSMSPDLMYFLQMNGEEDYGHTLSGIFVFDIPITLLLTLVFHLWIRNTLLIYLPAPLNGRFAKYRHQNIITFLKKRWYLVAFSAFVGAISHIAWDQLGSPHGQIYKLAPDFFGAPLNMGPFNTKMYNYIEYMGSIVGLLGIAWALWQEKKEEPIDQVSKRGKLLFWACIVIFTALVIAIKLYVNPLRYSLGSMFVIGISGFFLAVIVTCFLFRIKKENRQIRELSR